MRSRARVPSTGRAQRVAVLLCTSALVGCATGTPVTGTDKETLDYQQSETALTTAFSSGKNIVVVAFNDNTDPGGKIVYTPTTRTVFPGASLAGWSYSTDEGATWTYGGRLTPPKGWDALWSDPAATTSRNHYNVVYLSYLAIPSIPEGGISGPVNAYLGGACIARSTDGGRSFGVHQMITNNQHFYDGGSMAASKKGEVYAAFVDLDTHQIDVWSAPNDSAQFDRLSNPFPKMTMVSHPKIRTSPFDGSLYVAAQAANQIVYMTRWSGSNWAPAVQVTDGPAELYPVVQFSTGTVVRTGPQFSFDIGASSLDGGKDAIRLMYTRRDEKTERLYVTSTYGRTDLSGFSIAPQWGTTPGNLNTPGDQFNPNVRAWPGFFGFPPVWKATYMNRDPGAKDTLDLEQGNLAYLPNGSRIYVPFSALDDIPVCPDQRGYWGDYDDLEQIGFSDGGAAKFLRTVSDSTKGCQYRWDFTSKHLHVSGATFH